MTIPKEITWPIDPHTKAKHEILRRYLEAWFPILNKYHSRLVYIDGFCGPGRYEGGELGSPIIALRTAIDHTQAMRGELVFLFNDNDERRIKHLSQVLESMRPSIPHNFKVYTKCGLFDKEFSRLLSSIEEKGSRLAPTFAFIDPFGFSILPFTLIEKLLKQKQSETFITFMIDSINRWLDHPDPKVRQHIVDLFGTDECIRIGQMSGDRRIYLRTLYQKQLKRTAKFVRYFEMQDLKDKPIYYLFFASNHRLGHIKMKEAMWRVDPEGEFKFSDATDPCQTALFELDNTPLLANILYSKFRRRSDVLGQTIKEYVEDETAFLNKHKTIALKRLEEEQRIRVNPVQRNGKNRRANTYPDNALITFL